MIVTHAAGVGFGPDPLDLVVGAVDQPDPCAAVFAVASLCLFEDALDDGRWRLDDARGEPLVGGDRPRGALIALVLLSGEDVGRRARHRLGVMDSPDLGHPLVRSRVIAREPGLGSGAGRPGGGPGA